MCYFSPLSTSFVSDTLKVVHFSCVGLCDRALSNLATHTNDQLPLNHVQWLSNHKTWMNRAIELRQLLIKLCDSESDWCLVDKTSNFESDIQIGPAWKRLSPWDLHAGWAREDVICITFFLVGQKGCSTIYQNNQERL